MAALSLRACHDLGRAWARRLHATGVLGDVDEATRAVATIAETGDIDVTRLVHFGKREEGAGEPATIVEIELVGLIEDGAGIDSSTELARVARHAADHSGFHRQRDQVRDAVFGCDI